MQHWNAADALCSSRFLSVLQLSATGFAYPKQCCIVSGTSKPKFKLSLMMSANVIVTHSISLHSCKLSLANRFCRLICSGRCVRITFMPCSSHVSVINVMVYHDRVKYTDQSVLITTISSADPCAAGGRLIISISNNIVLYKRNLQCVIGNNWQQSDKVIVFILDNR